MKKFARLPIAITLAFTLLNTSCITVNQPQVPINVQPTPIATGTQTTNPPTTTSSRIGIEAFVANPAIQPNLNQNQQEFITVKKKVDGYFGRSYYTYRPDLVSIYQPQDKDKLLLALSNLKKLPWEYKLGYFDCSEMSGLVEFYLQTLGFDAWLVAGKDLETNSAHAWVVVMLSTMEVVPVEATQRDIPAKGRVITYASNATMTYDDFIKDGWVLQDIYQAEAGYPEEFDWWLSYPLSADDILAKVATGTAQPTNTGGIITSVSSASVPVAISPGEASSPGPVVSTLTPTLQWGGVAGADYYFVSIGRYDQNAWSTVYTKQPVSGNSISLPSGTLKLGVQYAWVVSAHGPWGWSPNSTASYFQTQGTATTNVNLLAAPTAISPGGASGPGSIVANLSPTLQWSSVAEAEYYFVDLQKYPFNGKADSVFPVEAAYVYDTSIMVPSGVLQPGQRYRWYVYAHSETGFSKVSNFLFFQTPK